LQDTPRPGPVAEFLIIFGNLLLVILAPMKIVVLDGFTLNPGDLSWEPLKELGECTFHERSAPGEVAPRLNEAAIVLTNKVVLDRATIQSLPELKYIGVTATGFNIVDVKAARERGVSVTNVPAYGTASVAQMTIALLLELTNRAGHHAETVRVGRWANSPDFCYWDFPLVELNGKTLGILGYGRIGREVANIARAFGMRILALRRPSLADEPNITATDLETLLRESDVVSLHCPLTPETKGLVNAERLRLMKRTAFLLNTSRGPLIVEDDLNAALRAGTIAGAGLDVLSIEPPIHAHPLYNAPNCYITPHISWASFEARQRLMNTAVENVRAWLKGTPQNVVN
jgi:glycerate dehydrogenase